MVEKVPENTVALSFTEKVFSKYFPELQLPDIKQSVPESAQFLVKCMGFTARVASLLGRSCAKTKKDQFLIKTIEQSHRKSTTLLQSPSEIKRKAQQVADQLATLKESIREGEQDTIDSKLEAIQQLLLELADLKIDKYETTHLSSVFQEAHSYEMLRKQPR